MGDIERTFWSLYIIFLFAFFLVFASSYLSVRKFHIIFLSLLLLNVIHGNSFLQVIQMKLYFYKRLQ